MRLRILFLFFFFFFHHDFYFSPPQLVDLLDKTWWQVSSLSPPGTCLQFWSRIGLSIPTARRFSSNVANSHSRAFRKSIARKKSCCIKSMYGQMYHFNTKFKQLRYHAWRKTVSDTGQNRPKSAKISHFGQNIEYLTFRLYGQIQKKPCAYEWYEVVYSKIPHTIMAYV